MRIALICDLSRQDSFKTVGERYLELLRQGKHAVSVFERSSQVKAEDFDIALHRVAFSELRPVKGIPNVAIYRVISKGMNLKGFTEAWLPSDTVGHVEQTVDPEQLIHTEFVPFPIPVHTYLPAPVSIRKVIGPVSFGCFDRIDGFERAQLVLRAFLEEFSADEDVYLGISFASPTAIPNDRYRQIDVMGERRLSEEQLIRFYNSLTAFISMGGYRVQGNAACEAMSCGIPVISSPTGDKFNLITEDNSWLIDNLLSDDALVAQLRVAMRNAAQNPVEARKRGKAARIGVLKTCSYGRVLSKVNKRMEALVKEHNTAKEPANATP